MKRCVSIDWLQLRCRMTQIFDNMCPDALAYECLKSKHLKVERLDYAVRNFAANYRVICKHSNEEVATINAQPRSNLTMAKDMCLIKVNNKYLYQADLHSYVLWLLSELQLTFLGVTRLDIACDMLSFDSMRCERFVAGLMPRWNKVHNTHEPEYLKEKQSTIKFHGASSSVERGKITGGISSVKWGKETCPINYYLYDKVIEMKDVKHKPWIAEHWCTHGWDGKAHVWRLEFSTHSTTDGYLSEQGELIHYKSLDVIRNDNYCELFKVLYSRHFNFVHTSRTAKGNYRKQSRCEKLELLKDFKIFAVKMKLSNKKEGSRSAKIFAKRLMETNHDMRGIGHDISIASKQLLSYTLAQYDLITWAKKKYPDVDLDWDMCALATRKIALDQQLNYKHKDISHVEMMALKEIEIAKYAAKILSQTN